MTSDAADILRDPLTVVDQLFHAWTASHGTPTAEWGEREHFVRALGLEDEQAFARIPCLNDQAIADAVRPFSLVRYRALVQDVFEPEIYISRMEEAAAEAPGTAAAAPAPPRVVPTKYRELLEPPAGRTLRELGRDGLSQRGVCYCVPIPGETAWARAASAKQSPQGSPGAAPPTSTPAATSKKRSQPDEDVDMDSTTDMAVAPPPEAPVNAPPAARRARAAGHRADTTTVADAGMNADAFGLNFPLPWEERRGHGSSTACIVKLYDADADSLRLCDTVEFVGILCINPELANLQAEAPHLVFGEDARHPSTALVPRLHALLVRKLPFHHPLLPYSPDWLTEARLAAAYQSHFAASGSLVAARAAAIAQLLPALGGDTVAAEYALMLLTSRCFAKCGEQSLGCWSLNLARWPQGAEVSSFSRALAELAPRVVQLDLNGQSLNCQRWLPRKDYEANRLVAGQLQLAQGTLLVLDETKLTEGQITNAGLQALTALRELVTSQILNCDFQVQNIKVPLEVSSIVVSNGRSIVKGLDALLPLRPTSRTAPEVGDPAALDAMRLLLGLVTRSPKALSISQAVANQVSNDFAQVRGTFQVPAELIHTWMGMARAYCLAFGESDLSCERWQAVLQLERERLRRCAEEGFNASA